ncbi:MAG: type II toxin-antitoxin system RelE/ParE family toxin [Anaerolineales bacterium]|nr:type II toxin-antitoxin system RelE/ParE family toxin [Anaerolineales bacterium]
MSPTIPFTLIFAPEIRQHLARIERKHQSLIRQTIREQLRYSPSVQTKNRKLLEPPAPYQATWELRFGPENRFRAFYEVDTPEHKVYILAVGVKEGNRLFIGDEEYTK